MYRIYTEEKIKYIMKMTDENEDILTLEKEFGKHRFKLTSIDLN
jgi:NADH dehydrogenase (ubiquinone) 1 alpha subcomplex subunit 5